MIDSIEKLLLRAQREIDIGEAALENPDLNKKAKKEIKAKIKQIRQHMKRIRKLRKS